MKKKMILAAATLAALSMTAGASAATIAPEQTNSTFNKMLHKLGRGVVNIFTSPVEIPRHIAAEWERTDPVTGFFVGGAKGVGWGFARFATGIYDTFTFPAPVPADYQPLMYPEFVITDTWADPIPDLTELDSNDPLPGETGATPNRFRF